ncbi:hypothetical protein FRC11_011923, partial [Ceratobasidium sp. 423]
LLPKECEEPSQVLLFMFAQWHGLAKLWLHTSETLKILKRLTVWLGLELCNFAELTEGMNIHETLKEYSKHHKQQEARTSSMNPNKAKSKSKPQAQDALHEGRQHCSLNLNTYKVHSMVDYVSTIEEYGTTDSYSTQIPETQHRTVKVQHERTNGKDAVGQMMHIDAICNVLQDMEGELAQRHCQLSGLGNSTSESDGMQSLLEGSQYTIGQTD